MLSDEFHGSVETVVCVHMGTLYTCVCVCMVYNCIDRKGLSSGLQICHRDLREEVTQKT